MVFTRLITNFVIFSLLNSQIPAFGGNLDEGAHSDAPPPYSEIADSGSSGAVCIPIQLDPSDEVTEEHPLLNRQSSQISDPSNPSNPTIRTRPTDRTRPSLPSLKKIAAVGGCAALAAGCIYGCVLNID